MRLNFALNVRPFCQCNDGSINDVDIEIDDVKQQWEIPVGFYGKVITVMCNQFIKFNDFLVTYSGWIDKRELDSSSAMNTLHEKE